jgi:glycosyltransferase involved in cell wall biosynthesis
MKHPKNNPSNFEKYFISRVSFNENLGLMNRLKIVGRVLYSFEAKRKFRKLLNDFKPEIIHAHNIYHHLSPSILSAAKAKKIPVVMHLHDYKLICPNHSLFVKGKYCERCAGKKYYNCFKNRCVKNSLPGSILATLEMFLHHNILKIYENKVAKFIAPSRFMKEICVRFGQRAEQIEVLYNPYSREYKEVKNNEEQNLDNAYILYFGRLSEEKGIDVLIRAIAGTKEKLVIAGSGEEEEKLKALALEIKAEVEFVGFKSGDALRETITKAKAIVIPSIWAENMPLSLLEAMRLGKIAFVSNVGGLPEAIEDGKNGFLFKLGDFRELASKINFFTSLSAEEKKEMSHYATLKAELFSPDKNLSEIINLYKKVLNY